MARPARAALGPVPRRGVGRVAASGPGPPSSPAVRGRAGRLRQVGPPPLPPARPGLLLSGPPVPVLVRGGFRGLGPSQADAIGQLRFEDDYNRPVCCWFDPDRLGHSVVSVQRVVDDLWDAMRRLGRGAPPVRPRVPTTHYEAQQVLDTVLLWISQQQLGGYQGSAGKYTIACG